MLRKLVVSTLFYYWRTNFAVLLGVAAATAVIGGALVVGDSVKDSLRQMTLDRLGQIDHVLTGPRFFEESLADRLDAQTQTSGKFQSLAPAIVMQTSLETERTGDAQLLRRAGQVNLYGIDARLWDLTEHGDTPLPMDQDLVLSSNLAEALGVAVGETLVVALEIPSSIPRDSLLGKNDDDVREIVLTVSAILPQESGVGRLGLHPSQQLPLNAFISLDTLQETLDLDQRRRSRSLPDGRVARTNALFAAAKSAQVRAPQGADDLNAAVSDVLTLADLDLRVRENKSPAYLSLESSQLILETAVADAAEELAGKTDTTSPVLVYLINEFRSGKADDAFSMYSVVAGLDADVFTSDAKKPFGPFEYVGPPPEQPLGKNDIILNSWLAEDLKVGVGDKISLAYFLAGSKGELGDETRTFTVRGITKLDGTPAADLGLTPEVKGITDVDTMDDWEQPFEMDMGRITSRDDSYWTEYRGTPKAFVTLETAQKLWTSRYGDLTSFRFVPGDGETLQAARERWEQELPKQLAPDKIGMAFQPIKALGLMAASGTTDFSGLFIGFSFFIILSATILVGLLFRLGIEQRAAGVGLLLAVGFTPKQTRNMLLAEGLVIVAAGGLLGVGLAIAYAHLMVYGLKTWWIGAIGTRFLLVSIHPVSLAIGWAISVIVAMLAVWWAMRGINAIPVRRLLAGDAQKSKPVTAAAPRLSKTFMISAGLAILLTVGVLTGLVPQSEAFGGFSWTIVCFFVVGISLLVASLALLSYRLAADTRTSIHGRGLAGLRRLSRQNAARNRSRSVLTAGLIASATFVVAAVAAGHRNPAVERPDKNSGNGGYTFIAESSQPILFDLNTEDGRAEFGLDADASKAALKTVHSIAQFRVRLGEDASCLNIFQTRLPTILGVPQQLIDPPDGQRRFKFADTPGENPWKLLDEPQEDGTIPVLGDMNTLMYSLHKGIGQTVDVPGGKKLKIMGMFDGSVFQGQLLMSAANFDRVFPHAKGGSQYFLIDVAYDDNKSLAENRQVAEGVEKVLESKIGRGFDAQFVSDRLASFLAVQNTYLSTFLALGGLGLLLGTFGLATVMLRNVFERRSELALMRAVGFRNTSLIWLVLWENGLLLVWGLAAGTLSALAAMLPHLLTTGADVPWGMGAEVLAAIFLAGMFAALFAVRKAVQTPVLETLRGE